MINPSVKFEYPLPGVNTGSSDRVRITDSAGRFVEISAHDIQLFVTDNPRFGPLDPPEENKQS